MAAYFFASRMDSSALTSAVILYRVPRMTSDPRITLQTMKVLQLFCERAPEELAGIDIAKSTGIASGTLYPLLARLEIADWLESRWEDIDPHKEQRPRRRYYRLTDAGSGKVERLFAEFRK